MRRIVRADFFDRNAEFVAPDLLGKFLVVEHDGNAEACMITETEAYIGPEDLASHSSRGRTKRTDVMFGEPGHWYVYFIYGMYEMLNIVTGPGKHPSAVLIRGVEGHYGPGKLTKAMRIDRSINTKPASRKTGVWIEDRGFKVDPRSIIATPRIGVAYAGEWTMKPLRFVLKI